MELKAYKMDGLGNDFVIIDNREQIINLSKDQIIKICDRSFIGCDQLILIKNSKVSDALLNFFNSDGGVSGACGNGTRCVADLLSRESKKKIITVTTLNGNLKSKILGNRTVTTEIGVPKISWNQIPLSKKLNTYEAGNIEMDIPLLESEYKNKNDLIFFVLLFTYLFIFLIFKNKSNAR